MLRNIKKIFLYQLSAATDRICSLQEEQQQLREQNELIRERSEKSVEVRNWPHSWVACLPRARIHGRAHAHCWLVSDAGLRTGRYALFGAAGPSHTTCRPSGPLGVSKHTAPSPLCLCTQRFPFTLQPPPTYRSFVMPPRPPSMALGPPPLFP